MQKSWILQREGREVGWKVVNFTNILRAAFSLSLDEFRIGLKIIWNSTRKLKFEFEFSGPKTVYQSRILSNLPPNKFEMTNKWLFQNKNVIFKLKMPIF